MSSPAGESRAGVIGLGNLGLPMALRLLDAGWSVDVLDRRPTATAQCVEAGATAAGQPVELAACSVISIVVPDDEAVRSVLVESGLLERLQPGALVAVHSTILPTTAVELAERAAEHGVLFTDAPVSGGADRARSGDLTVMAGGTEKSMHRAADYFAAVSHEVVHVGPAGCGAAVKLGNQLMMFASLAATYEAVELCETFGVLPETLFQAVTTSTGDSWIVRNWGFFDRTALDYDKTEVPVSQRPWSKDLWDVLLAGRSAGLHLPLAGVLSQLMPDRVEAHAHAQEPS